MKSNATTVNCIVLTGSAVVLACLGCVLCWLMPVEWLWGGNRYHLFVRQLSANGIGILCFICALRMGWKNLLRVAPWLMVAWVGLLFMAFAGRPINGVYRWVEFGPVRLNVRTVLWPIAALFAGWLCSRRGVKPWMVISLIGCVSVAMSCVIFSNTQRLERISVFFDGLNVEHAKMYMQCQLRAALEAANWFGCSGRSFRLLPCANTDGIVAGAALALGKWLPIFSVALMAMIGSCLTCMYLSLRDSAKRMYVFVFGVVLVGPALWNYLQCLMMVPVFGCTFSLLGYGGTDVVCTWLGMGIALSTGVDYQVSKKKSLLVCMIALVAWMALTSAILWAPKPMGRCFAEPMMHSV